jgi:hypothetical protein
MAANPPTIEIEKIKLDQLYELLGAYVAINQGIDVSHPGALGMFDLQHFRSTIRSSAELRRLGRRYFGLVEDALYRILCGDESDSNWRAGCASLLMMELPRWLGRSRRTSRFSCRSGKK